jgi:hypothetical protein
MDPGARRDPYRVISRFGSMLDDLFFTVDSGGWVPAFAGTTAEEAMRITAANLWLPRRRA